MDERQIIGELVDVTVKVFYKGEWYLLIQYQEMKIVLKQVEEDGKIRYQVPPFGVREELLELMGPDVISKIGRMKDTKVEVPPVNNKKKGFKTVASLLLAFIILSSTISRCNDYIYVGVDYETLLEELPSDSLDLEQMIDGNLNFEDSEYDGIFSDLEKEEFRNRAKRFASYLTEEEQEVFKYQLSTITIKKWGGVNNVRFSARNRTLYIENVIRESDYTLEYAFCNMIQNCFLENEQDYYIFNNQRFFDTSRVELGEDFSFYNYTLFIYCHYPEYQQKLSRILGTEEALYYQLMLQVLDSNITYLPLNYQMEDVLKAYQKISPSKKKTTDLFGQIGIVQSFKNNGNFADYETRYNVIELSNEYFVKREKQMAMQYSLATLMEDEKGELGEKLIRELTSHYHRYLSLIDQINSLNQVQIGEIWRFEREYQKEVIPYVYRLEKIFQMIPEDMTQEEFKYYFLEKMNQEVEEDTENLEKKVTKIYQIFHYPLSTH